MQEFFVKIAILAILEQAVNSASMDTIFNQLYVWVVSPLALSACYALQAAYAILVILDTLELNARLAVNSISPVRLFH